MALFTLIYFPGCPKVDLARKNLAAAGLAFIEVNLDALSADDPLTRYASPTLLQGKRVLFGSQADQGTRSCSLDVPGPEEILRRLDTFKGSKTSTKRKGV